MRIAVISDIHGNLPALEATLEHLDGEELDEIVVAGDLVNGAPDSLACWRLIRSLGHPLLRGNHERYLFDLGTANEEASWRTERFAPVRWAARQFTAEDLEEMRSLPLCYVNPEYADLLVVHASPESDNTNIRPYTAASEIEPLFAAHAVALAVRGHNHIANMRTLSTMQLVTTGSVGMPLDGQVLAQFLLLERRQGAWQIEHRAVPYDVGATISRFRESGYLEEAGPMARMLLREIATASHHMLPFLRYWFDQPEGERQPFGEAVEDFLNAY